MDLAPLLAAIAKLVLLICVYSAFSLLLSFLLPRILGVLAAVVSGLRALRDRITSSVFPWIASLTTTFWSRRSREPLAPVVVQLGALADAVSRIGHTQIQQLNRLDSSLSSSTSVLRGLAATTPNTATVEAVSTDAQTATDNLWFTLLLSLMALGFGITNAFLLNIYFQDTLGSYPLLPYPLPQIEVSHVLAVLFALGEVIAGILLHVFDNVSLASATVRFFRLVPWFGISALVLIEIYAYALLSVKIDMPSRLEIDPASSFYPIAKYFLAFFGAVITLLLACLGYMIWSTGQSYARARRALLIAKTIKGFTGSLRAMGRTFDQLKTKTDSFRPALVDSFRVALGDEGQISAIAAALEDRLRALLAPLAESSDAGAPLRKPSQIIGDLCIGAMLFVLWFGLALVNFDLFFEYLSAYRAVGWSTTIIALGLSLSVTLLGYTIKDAYRGSRYAALATAQVPGMLARTTLIVVSGVICLLALIIGVAAAVHNRQFGDSLFINSTYGLFVVLMLTLVSGGLDIALVTTIHLVFLAALAILAGLTWLCQGLFVLLEGFFRALGHLLRFLAVAGDWLRSLFAEH